MNNIGFSLNNCAICNRKDSNLHPVRNSRKAPKVCTPCMKVIKR